MRLEEAGRREPGVIPPPRRAARTVVLAGRYGLIHLTGERDVATAPDIRDAVRESLTGRPALLRIDISGVSFCDCSGLGALLWGAAGPGRQRTGGTRRKGSPPRPAADLRRFRPGVAGCRSAPPGP